MELKSCALPSFAVIGKEGSTKDGPGFVGRLWEQANGAFDEVAHLAQRDEKGDLVGIWGAMSDPERRFDPWTNDFQDGLYLAGVQCPMDAQAPEGWVKWVLPGYDYLYVENEGPDTFRAALAALKAQGHTLAGAVHDFTCPKTGKPYCFFPIRRL